MVKLNTLRKHQAMNKPLFLGLAFMALYGTLGPASAADPGSETRPVDARVVRVRVDGAVDLHIRQGNPAALVLSTGGHSRPPLPPFSSTLAQGMSSAADSAPRPGLG